MTKKNSLGTVPDTSMLTLFQSIVNFLTSEASDRGWSDITDRLKAVDSALRGRSGEPEKAD